MSNLVEMIEELRGEGKFIEDMQPLTPAKWHELLAAAREQEQELAEFREQKAKVGK